MAESAPRLPVLVLAGFLGSGKTTLLNRLLRDPACADAAVLVNEFGEVGLDHQLVLHARDRLVVLPGGCVCCALREDVEGALRELFEQRDSGRIVPFRRIVIETTGLADPVPLLLTLQSFGLARARLQRAQVLATVDALLGVATLARFTEAVRQVAAADVVLLTKTDLADAAQEASARAAVEALNPWCPVLGTRSGPDAPPTPSAPVEAATLLRALDAAADAAPEAAGAPPPAGRLDATAGRYRPVAGAAAHAACSFALRLDEPLDWGAFGVWLTALLHRHGERILRVKGIIAVAGLAAPVVFHAAQHMVHPPQHLPAWPSDDRRSHIVFIVLGLEPERIRRSLQAFNRVATRLAAAPPLARVKPAGAGGTVAGRPVRRPTAPSWIRG